jgi:hypothetical protein
VKGCHNSGIELQQRFAARANDKGRAAARPFRRHGVRERHSVSEAPAIGAVGPHEICIAEAADCVLSINLAAKPEIAPRETTEDGGPSCLRSFTLQGVKDFFDRIAHWGKPSCKKNRALLARGASGPRSIFRAGRAGYADYHETIRWMIADHALEPGIFPMAY